MAKISKVNKKKMSSLGKGIILVGGLTGVMVAGIMFNNYMHSLKKFENDLIDNGVSISENAEYGTIDSEKKDDIKFSIADCGNSGTELSDNAKKILEDTKIPTGIIVNPQCKELYQIYEEVDYTKKIITEYNVEYPVFLNINGMFNVMMNEYPQINNMINAYVNKLQANGCYVVVIGDRTFLDILKQERENEEKVLGYNEADYPIGIIVDEIEKVNDELFTVILGKDYVYSREHFKNIVSNNYNKESLFVDPFEYIVQDGDNLSYISNEYNISVDDIKNYNKIGNTIHPGDKIDLPNKYQPAYYRGIDISYNQGNIDWKSVGSNIDFAILRVGYTSKDNIAETPSIVDPYFHYNMSECNRNNIPVGLYYKTSSISKYQIDEEINVLLKQLGGYDVSLPIYVNILEDVNLEDAENRVNVVELADYFCSKIKDAGYTPGIYVHQNNIAYIPELVKKYTIWGYGGLHYNLNQSYNELNYDYILSEQVPVFQTTIAGTASDVNVSESLFIGYNYADRDFINSLLENRECKVKRYRNK